MYSNYPQKENIPTICEGSNPELAHKFFLITPEVDIEITKNAPCRSTICKRDPFL